MRKFLSLFLSFFLIMSSVNAATLVNIPSEEIGGVYYAIEQQVEKSPNRNLVNFIISFAESSIREELNFDDIEEYKKAIFGDLFAVIEQTNFSPEEVIEISNFFKWNLRTNDTSDLFYMLAGVFLAHKDFSDFRGNIIDTINNRNLNNNAHPENTMPYILALKEVPSLDIFLSESFPLDIISVLERKVQELSYLGQKSYVGRGTLPHRSTYLNEYAANRCFLEAYSYFTPKEGDSFFKTFVTTTIPLLHSLPGRNLKGEYLDNEDGMAHALAFEIIDILIRHYILTEQDGEVYRFIEDNAFREGPYYFQFALDALGIANTQYQILEGENADARHNLWEEKQEAFIADFKASSPVAKRLIVLINKTSQLYLEYYAIGKILSFTGKYVLSPATQAAFGLLPKNVQLRINTKIYLTKGYIRKNVQKYLHDAPRHLWKRVVGRGGRFFLVHDPKNIGAMRTFLKGSLRQAGIAEDTEIYQFFKALTFNAEDDVTFNYLRNATEYISRADLEEFFRLYKNIPSTYKGTGSFCRIRVLNNKIVPEIENTIVTDPKRILANLRDMMTQGGRVLTAESGEGGKVFSKFRLDNGTVIRFGKHEMIGDKIHIHFEKPFTIEGSTYILNKSFIINSQESLKALAGDNVKILWALSEKGEQEGFLRGLRGAAEADYTNNSKLIGEKVKQYIYKLNDYFLGDESKRAVAISRLMRLTEKTTEKDAIDEALHRVLEVSAGRGANPTLHEVYRTELLDKTLNTLSGNMSNEEAVKILQWAMLENTKNPRLIGFSFFSTTAIREMTWESYVDRPQIR